MQPSFGRQVVSGRAKKAAVAVVLYLGHQVQRKTGMDILVKWCNRFVVLLLHEQAID